MTCRRKVVPILAGLMSRAKIPVAEIGKVRTGEGLIMRRGSRRKRYVAKRDRYWDAYARFLGQNKT